MLTGWLVVVLSWLFFHVVVRILDVGIGDGGGRQCNAKLKYEPAAAEASRGE
jgi:hypothetical protein